MAQKCVFPAVKVDSSSVTCPSLKTIPTVPQPANSLQTCGIRTVPLSVAIVSKRGLYVCAYVLVVYKDGRVCISILHKPGNDPTGYEDASERWSPVHTVETIMLSIISMLSSPNDESAANIDAAKDWREDREGFKKKVARIVRRSQEML